MELNSVSAYSRGFLVALCASAPWTTPLAIDPDWSKAKSALRAAEARTREVLEAALVPALDSIPPQTHAAGSTCAVTYFQTEMNRFRR